MKHFLVFTFLLFIVACGKRCELTPTGEESPAYPRQYPQEFQYS